MSCRDPQTPHPNQGLYEIGVEMPVTPTRNENVPRTLWPRAETQNPKPEKGIERGIARMPEVSIGTSLATDPFQGQTLEPSHFRSGTKASEGF